MAIDSDAHKARLCEGYVSTVEIEDEFDSSASSGSIPARSRSSSRCDMCGGAVSGVWGVHVAGEGPAGAPGQGSARIGAADHSVVAEASIAVR